jgi:hypothetical protein
MNLLTIFKTWIGKHMPYMKVREGKQTCVYKEGADKKPMGESMGCHDTDKEADDQMAALYAAMADEKKTFLVWKDKVNQYQWIATYSNNIRDDDSPPEIISESSHLGFISKVEKGLVEYPELWLWHTPEWMVGKATWLAWDDSGFAMAAGYFNKGCEAVAEALMAADDVRVSHGMPASSIKRSKEDPTVIVEHTTKEISPLPGFAAANRWTGFITLEDTVMIDQQKKEMLKKSFGIDENVIAKIEQLNEGQASKAKELGLETKAQPEVVTPVIEPEKADEVVETKPVAPVAVVEPVKVEPVIAEPVAVAPITEPEKEKPVEPSLTKEDIAAVVNEALKGLTLEIAQVMDAQNRRMEKLERQDNAKVAEKAAVTPRASLLSTIQSLRATNQDATKMTRTERTDGPRETKEAKPGMPGILQSIAAGKNWREELQ